MKMIKVSFFKIMTAFSIVVVSLFFLAQKRLKTQLIENEAPYVNVYCWYGMIPRDVIDQFQKETGISVRFDVYDSNEVLEAKLLATNSGYDVVFPSAVPYAARQIQVGVYQKIDHYRLSNLKNLNEHILSQMKLIDPNMEQVIPYFWGTTGIAIDLEKVSSIVPSPMSLGFELLFNPEIIKKIAPYGVSFLEEPVDVFPQIQAFLGLDPLSENITDLKKAYEHLLRVRPYIKRFSSARFINDMVMGDVAVALAWSGDAQKAKEIGQKLGKKLIYFIPKEGSAMWIECIGIPMGAPHPKNAHRFINFILRPDISGRITNFAAIPTVVLASYPYVDKDLRQEEFIFPSKEILKRLRLDKPGLDEGSMEFDRQRTRMWAQVKLSSGVNS